MNLPAKIEYAYKAVLELAIRYKGENPVQLSAICQAQGIPRKFLTQLLLRLKNSGIINSSRGVEGGYYLTRHPSRISLADVFKAIDDSFISSAKPAKSGRSSDADNVIRRIWADINKEAARRLEEITFDKLITQVRKSELTYQI